MSSTRHASPGSPLRQERFSSSPEFELGLMAHLVAKRARLLRDRRDKEIVWWLQWRSHQEGGLDQVASELCEMFPDRIGTDSMRKARLKRGQACTAGQVRAIRKELLGQCGTVRFPLPGEADGPDAAPGAGGDDGRTAYDGGEFLDACQAELGKLPEILATLCLDPARSVESYRPRFFPSLVSSLIELRAACIERKSQAFVETEVSRRVWDALDYGLQARCLVLADGPARTGKTFAVKEWVRRKAGMARYVQVPPTTNRKSFFLAIAAALGVPVNLKSKSCELEERIGQTLHGGDLALVLDEAHYLWQPSIRPTSKPDRVNWLLVELVNFEVPVALVTTPQFYHSQRQVERATGWSSEQFLGRIGHVERLPERLEWDDLLAVAKAALPEATAKVARGLAAYAESSARHLASIEAIAKRARYLAARAGRSGVVDEDVAKAMKGSVIPSDSALANALEESLPGDRRTARKGRITAPASPVQSPFTGVEKPVVEAPDRTDLRPLELGRLKQPAERGVPDALLIAAG